MPNPRPHEVEEVGSIGRDVAQVPGCQDFGPKVRRQQPKHPTPFSPVPGGQVAKRLVVTKMVGVESPNVIRGCFLFGQHLAGEQGDALTLAGQGAFCRGKPTRRDASGLKTFKDAASDFQGALGYATDMAYRRWDVVRGVLGWGLAPWWKPAEAVAGPLRRSTKNVPTEAKRRKSELGESVELVLCSAGAGTPFRRRVGRRVSGPGGASRAGRQGAGKCVLGQSVHAAVHRGSITAVHGRQYSSQPNRPGRVRGSHRDRRSGQLPVGHGIETVGRRPVGDAAGAG